jgi:hypothetical protein
MPSEDAANLLGTLLPGVPADVVCAREVAERLRVCHPALSVVIGAPKAQDATLLLVGVLRGSADGTLFWCSGSDRVPVYVYDTTTAAEVHARVYTAGRPSLLLSVLTCSRWHWQLTEAEAPAAEQVLWLSGGHLRAVCALCALFPRAARSIAHRSVQSLAARFTAVSVSVCELAAHRQTLAPEGQRRMLIHLRGRVLGRSPLLRTPALTYCLLQVSEGHLSTTVLLYGSALRYYELLQPGRCYCFTDLRNRTLVECGREMRTLSSRPASNPTDPTSGTVIFELDEVDAHPTTPTTPANTPASTLARIPASTSTSTNTTYGATATGITLAPVEMRRARKRDRSWLAASRPRLHTPATRTSTDDSDVSAWHAQQHHHQRPCNYAGEVSAVLTAGVLILDGRLLLILPLCGLLSECTRRALCVGCTLELRNAHPLFKRDQPGVLEGFGCCTRTSISIQPSSTGSPLASAASTIPVSSATTTTRTTTTATHTAALPTVRLPTVHWPAMQTAHSFAEVRWALQAAALLRRVLVAAQPGKPPPSDAQLFAASGPVARLLRLLWPASPSGARGLVREFQAHPHCSLVAQSTSAPTQLCDAAQLLKRAAALLSPPPSPRSAESGDAEPGEDRVRSTIRLENTAAIGLLCRLPDKAGFCLRTSAGVLLPLVVPACVPLTACTVPHLAAPEQLVLITGVNHLCGTRAGQPYLSLHHLSAVYVLSTHATMPEQHGHHWHAQQQRMRAVDAELLQALWDGATSPHSASSFVYVHRVITSLVAKVSVLRPLPAEHSSFLLRLAESAERGVLHAHSIFWIPSSSNALRQAGAAAATADLLKPVVLSCALEGLRRPGERPAPEGAASVVLFPPSAAPTVPRIQVDLQTLLRCFAPGYCPPLASPLLAAMRQREEACPDLTLCCRVLATMPTPSAASSEYVELRIGTPQLPIMGVLQQRSVPSALSAVLHVRRRQLPQLQVDSSLLVNCVLLLEEVRITVRTDNTIVVRLIEGSSVRLLQTCCAPRFEPRYGERESSREGERESVCVCDLVV